MSSSQHSVNSVSSRRSSLSSNSSSAAVFSQRIVHVDSYTAIPISNLDVEFSEFRGKEIRRVPVLRIFGATPKGQKVCAHIHGVFPYLYILFPYDYDQPEENFEQRLAFALDKGITSALNWNSNGAPPQHVYKIIKVTGRPFYGFKFQEDVFLKIYFYSPIGLRKAEEILQSGEIFGRHFQSHESHIPYVLQFLMDFKLYGMNFIHFRNIKFRRQNGSLPCKSSSGSLNSNPIASGGVLNQSVWNISEIPGELLLPTNVVRKSRCELEIDVLASDIIVSQSSVGKNPGIDAIWMDEKERRRLHQIEDWANVTIPNSQDRVVKDFVFPRERELLDQLRTTLQTAQSPEKNAGFNPIHLELNNLDCSQIDDEIPPASQTFLNDDLEIADLLTPNRLSQRRISDLSEYGIPEIEMNEEDNDIIAMMEDMARERITENDSIIGNVEVDLINSQLVDHQEDDEEEDMSHVVVPEPESENVEVDMIDSEEELKKWSQENLSQSMLEQLEEWERNALEEEGTAASTSRKQEQPIDQCDGQFDNSSSSEDSTAGIFKEKRKRQKIEFELDQEPKTQNKPENSKLKRHSSSASLVSRNFVKQLSRERLDKESGSKHGSQPSSSSTPISAGTSRLWSSPVRTGIVRKRETNFEDSDVVFLKNHSPKKSLELLNSTFCSRLDNERLNSDQELITIHEDENPPSDDGSSTVSESEFTIVTRHTRGNSGNGNSVDDEEIPKKKPLLEEIEAPPGPYQSEIGGEGEEPQGEGREDLGVCSEESGGGSSANQSLGIRSYYDYSQSLSLGSGDEDEILDSQVEHGQGDFQEKSITDYVLEIEKSNKMGKTHHGEIIKDFEDHEGGNNLDDPILSSPENENEEELLGNQSLGITSYYEYSQPEVVQDDEEMDVEEGVNKISDRRPCPENHTDSENSSNSERNETSDDSKTMEGEEFSGSDSTSENSMYGYDSLSGSSSEDLTPGKHTSFEDVSSQLSYRESDSSDTDTSQSKCGIQIVKAGQGQRTRRRREEAEQEKRRPSVWPYILQPLKKVLNSTDYHQWYQKRGERMSYGEEPEPWSLAYSKCKNMSRLPREVSHARKSFRGDIMAYKDRYEGKIPNQATTSATAVAARAENKPKSCGEAIAPDTDDSSDDDDEINRVVKPFRFTSGNDDASDLSASGSEFDLSDTETNKTVVESPRPNSPQQLFTPPPSVSSQGSVRRNSTPATGKASGKFRRRPSTLNISRRTSLNLNLPFGQTQSQSSEQSGSGSAAGLPLPKFRPNDSELDSPSSRLSESEKIDANLEDLDESNFQNAKAFHEFQYLTTLFVEVHCASRGDFVPDPEHDQINGIFYGLHTDSASDDVISGHYLVGTPPTGQDSQENSNSVEYFVDEISMLKKFILFIQEFDPDILIGYEIQKFSWGYLIERGCKLGLNILQEFSRLLPLPYQSKSESQNQDSLESWNESVSGRIVLNLWKLLRHEITVTSYTFESVVFHILHERVHRLPYHKLTEYWNTAETKTKVIQYFQRRVDYNMRLIGKLDLINRTSELARLFGIQFFEVLSRGSQYRVESMMLRLAKPVNLIPPSPNPQQRSKMKAPEYLPLIMEPESKFYTDPVAVLDFQSLYPSMMMAYNYCFSTCIGRVHHLGQNDEFDFGCLSHKMSSNELASLLAENCIHISPCGVVFVKHQVRRGILGDMLEQILDTRQMVKRAMKKWKNDETLQKVLDSRQLGLKLIANVTYGYTSANFSGRMPCVEIADSVVSKGRETLQRAIDYVKENEHIFGGKVVYGDTDSLFVHFPGKTRAEAFVLAQQIVDDVTASNPKPVKLKLEKVYQPCILQTKKRYVGFAYETPDQKEPKYDAKGIETVRRDGCPATAKILEGTLKILFTTKDEIAVRKFVVEQFRKIFLGRVSLSKYMFARVYRGRMGYRPGACVASLEIAKKLAEKDPRSEPLAKERVPYIIVYDVHGSTLISRARRPEEFIGNPNLRLDSHYYIEKAIIPALNRCLALANLNVHKWYSEMPRRYLQSHYSNTVAHKKGTIEQYFARENCIRCNAWTQTGFCDNCFPTLDDLKAFLIKLKKEILRKYDSCTETCQTCSGETDMTCVNMSCSIKHKYLRYERDYKTRLPATRTLHSNVFPYDLDW